MRNKEKLQKAIELRHEIHQNPDLSNEERPTYERIIKFLKENAPSIEIVDKGYYVYAIYHSEHPERPRIAFRTEVDALPIEDLIDEPYKSCKPGVGHKCGHDGHSSAMCAFAWDLWTNGADRDVYLIFQHAEEDGTGAMECCSFIEEAGIAEVYAVHNMPGVPFGHAQTRPGTVNMASVGIEYTLTGTPTHASTPELGKNPARALSEMVLALDDSKAAVGAQGLILATVIQMDLGERAFGISASRGKLLLTVRGENENELQAFIEALNLKATDLCKAYGLQLSIEYYDRFPETRNDADAVSKVQRACEAIGMPFDLLEDPIRTSEDFGYFLMKAPGALIWLGAGEDVAPLHNAGFDYNDGLLAETCRIFRAIMEQ